MSLDEDGVLDGETEVRAITARGSRLHGRVGARFLAAQPSRPPAAQLPRAASTPRTPELFIFSPRLRSRSVVAADRKADDADRR